VAPTTPPPEPHPITQNELQAREREQRTSWEFKGPTPMGALRYLQSNEGWERDEIDGQPIVMGGTITQPDHWIIRRRPPVHGLSEASVAALIAMRRNTYRQNSFQYITGTPIDHLVTSVRELQGDVQRIREELLGKGLAIKEPQESNYYVLTQLGLHEVNRLIQVGAR
jgi:hypothetical protein